MKANVAIDKDFYAEARARGISPLTYLTEMARLEPPEIDAVYERALRRFGQKDDGSPRAGRIYAYAYDIAGLEKELQIRGIRTRGPGADTVEKFFTSANDTPLFPAYLATQIIAGVLAASLVPALAAAEVRISSHVQEKITLSDTSAQRTLKWIGEGSDLPKTKIARSEGNIKLYKYGRLLEASYESVRLMHLDIFSLMIQRMGMQIGIDETDDCLETLIQGDGSTGSAATVTSTDQNGLMDYDDLCKLRLAFPIGYQMDQVVASDAQLRLILNMAEFKDPLMGFNFQRTGAIQDILGAQWHRWTSTGSSSFAGNRLLGVDSRGAVVLYREGDLLEESSQLIDKQLYQRTMTEWVGFMKLDPNASQVLANN